MRARGATAIRGTDALYVSEIDSISFEENVVDWRPGERIAFRPFRLPLPHSLVVAAVAGLVAGLLFRAVGGGTGFAFITGATLVGLAVLRLIRGARRTLVFDWMARRFEDQRGFLARRVPFAELTGIELRSVEDRPLAAEDPPRYHAVVSVLTTEGPIELLHTSTPKENSPTACQALRPAAQWLSVTLELPLAVKCAAQETPPTEDSSSVPEPSARAEAEDILFRGELALVRAKYAEGGAGADTALFLRDALVAFAKVHEADPRSAKGLLAIAKICEEMDDPLSANKVYTDALEIDPEQAEVYSRRGFNHQLQGAFDEAIADYSEAIRLEPAEEEHYRHRGNAQVEAEHFREAASDFTRFLELTDVPSLSRALDSARQSRRATVFADRALAYWKMGDRDRAQADVTEALALDRGNAFAREVETILRHDPARF